MFWLAGLVQACPLSLPTQIIHVSGKPLRVEMATTPEARACGLSHRSELDPGSGMLFVYPSARALEFWMKDTHVALSIAFLDERGTVLSIQNMEPEQTQERYRSPQPAMYALETVRGWFSAHGIKRGDKVELPP
ncbi:MAG: hypothetical protein AMJ69_09555 [Gammaproteobacteria bacterium SG8_47]|nr:MAG: hypothetical protein AMJ69_09555 [Gammaproteobacteria bacterium SG8_47]